MRYYSSLLLAKRQQTVQDAAAKLWNLARNVKDGNELVLIANKGKPKWTQKSEPKQTNCHFLL